MLYRILYDRKLLKKFIPIRRKMYLKLPSANMLSKPVSFSLITMDGKVVSTLKVRAASGTEVMNVNKLANGKYQISITTATEVINKIIDVI